MTSRETRCAAALPSPRRRRRLVAFWYEEKDYDFNFFHIWLNVRTDGTFRLTDESEVSHIGCEYGEYCENEQGGESYEAGRGIAGTG